MVDKFSSDALCDRQGMRFAAIFKAEPECVKVLDEFGRVLQINPAGLAILGIESTEVVGHSMFEFIVPADHQRVRDCVAGALNSGGFSCEFEIATPSGSRRWLESHMVCLRDLAGKIEILAVTRDVTRIIQAEASLRESEERFRQIAENIQEVFWMLDVESDRVLYVSPAFEKIWGRDSKVLLEAALFWTDCVHPDDRERVREAINQRKITGLFDIEYRILRPDGSVRWIHDRGFPIYDKKAVIYRLAGIAADITNRKEAECKLARLNRLYHFSSRMNDAILHQRSSQALFEEACQIAVEDAQLAMCWIGLFDSQASVLKPVAAAGRVEGYLDDFCVPVEDFPHGNGPAGRAFRTGQPAITNDISNDPYFVTKEAALRAGFRSCAAFPIAVSAKTVGVLVFYAEQLDVFRSEEILLLEHLAQNLGLAVEAGEKESHKRRIESALGESEEKFRLIVENSTDLIAEIGQGGKFLYVSPNFRTLLGYEPLSLLGTDAFQLIHSEDSTLVHGLLAGPGGSVTHRYRHLSGSWRWLESAARRFSTSAGEDRSVVISRDITERLESAAAQALAETRIRQAQKMEALGTLAGGIAHDFNNILALILGNIDLAAADIPAGSEAAERLAAAGKAANRATGLVRQILTFSRRKDQERKVLDISQIVEEVVKLLRAGLPATTEIRTEIPDNLPKILGDSSQIYQVLMNLATNASHAMRSRGGVLTIALAPETVSKDLVRPIPGLLPGEFLKITVSDTGDGMLPEVADRVFEPFFTTKGVGEGTGLGLSIVHGIIKTHDGAIFVQSKPHQGTTFEIYFPALSGKPIAEPPLDQPWFGKGESILFIDDEINICSIVEGFLQRYGYNPVVFDSPLEALEHFRKSPAVFSAVVTDLTMPKITGLTVAQEIKRISPEIPIILVTGFVGNLTNDGLQSYGIDDLISKPFTPRELTTCLKRHLRS